MPAEVVIVAGGDHAFDLPHLRREGGAELVQFLLHAAGHKADVAWQLRVEKKSTCTSETRPIAVVGWKAWCCYLRIKPGDNNSCHYCSLLLPDGLGLRAEAVYDALKQVEPLIDRNWRNGRKERTTTLSDTNGPEYATTRVNEPATEQLPEGREEVTAGTDLSGWSKDPEKLQLTLLGIYETDLAGPYPTQDRYVDALAQRLGWNVTNRYAVGGVFTSLVRQGYIIKILRGSRAVGYCLSPEGRVFIKQLLPQDGKQAAPAASAPTVDPASVFSALAGLVQRYQKASQERQESRTRRAQLQAEAEQLDARIKELDEILDNLKVQSLWQQVLQVSDEFTRTVGSES